MIDNTNRKSVDAVNERAVLAQAADILARRTFGGQSFTTVEDTKSFLTLKLRDNEREVFAIMLLDGQHRLLKYEELFFGTINSASVYPREVVKAILKENAAAVIIAHNHPSGVAEPSQADIAITTRLKNALDLIDVPILDHIVVAQDCVSFAQRGLL
ncbi:MAG: RadC family protein [Paraglaciecola sp.]